MVLGFLSAASIPGLAIAFLALEDAGFLGAATGVALLVAPGLPVLVCVFALIKDGSRGVLAVFAGLAVLALIVGGCAAPLLLGG